jgi:hypothetical protein
MLRILAICCAAAIVSLSAACSSTNVSADLTPDRNSSETILNPSPGDDIMKSKGTSETILNPSPGDDIMKTPPTGTP